MSGKLKAHRLSGGTDPNFPSIYEVVKRAVLQKTDIGQNNNKYYNIELHKAGDKYRVYTQYGRTDDLDRNPMSGAREARYPSSASEAGREYDGIFKEKTGKSKGYVEVDLASSKVGSAEAHGKSSGNIDEQTKERITLVEDPKPDAPPSPPPSLLHPEVRQLVKRLYNEATTSLTANVNAKITAKGIETPLGILTLGQIAKGESTLMEIHKTLQEGEAGDDKVRQLQLLSSNFYSQIPSKLGRTKADAQKHVIDDLGKIADKQEVLQLMKDMLQVNGEKGNVLISDDVDEKFKAMNIQLELLQGEEALKMAQFAEKKQVKHRPLKVTNVFKLSRPSEAASYEEAVGNHQLLFHGSRARNWVGILTRGILLPKIVTSMGVNRTDAGWLGNGIYFGDTSCTAVYYAHPNNEGLRYLAVAQVALGKSLDYHKITYGLDRAPEGYDSTHGVRRQTGVTSQFDDDEYVVYRGSQQKLMYLVEFRA
jgi:poly [ADP-ribose] polymerase